jgi:beta-lactamase class A
MNHRRRIVLTAIAVAVMSVLPIVGRAAILPGPLMDLQTRLALASVSAPGRVGIAIKDLSTGYSSGYNADASMPAASTIKIPVMVEVFRQMSIGNLTLAQTVGLMHTDKDYGSGDLCDARLGTRYSVKTLLWRMITDSDNTATNMLIRVVGRHQINVTMGELGLHHTKLGDYIRSSNSSIRYALRSSPRDMVSLLESMARDQLVDPWSSREMLGILLGQQHNSLLPQPLPEGLEIAHKTGSLHDTLNDVGVVYLDSEPYVIAVMTTNLPSLNSGRRFIRNVSRLAYTSFERMATWRERSGLPAFQFSPVEDAALQTPSDQPAGAAGDPADAPGAAAPGGATAPPPPAEPLVDPERAFNGP